ncbi:DNA cytosine methyltransferase [Azospirillum thermophilum]|uniref:DNA cytosine methyltransferase n=1 Tax=Azospirillum thermophilum TaxID=2202148 RepID=UPI00143DD99B|nr:DNA cytosine methyltransferase [Azospirillum thermophilum]
MDKALEPVWQARKEARDEDGNGGRGTDWTVADLCSGAGGMSAGFARRQGFRIIGAIDLEQGKPSGGAGSLECNATYEANIGIRPVDADLLEYEPEQFREHVRATQGVDLKPGTLTVLSACTPCTDFSRTNPNNHLRDGLRNSLVARAGDYVEALRPEIMVMENARELLMGRQAHHFERLAERLSRLGYDVKAEIHFLDEFGLPQIRERALVTASCVSPARGLSDLWEGYEVDARATTVRSALSRLGEWRRIRPGDKMEVAPGMTPEVMRRLDAIPPDGGSWPDLGRSAATLELMIPSMRERWERRDLGSHPDVYGRMWWDRPAPTIKRECAHVGNGRYAHPVESRLLTVREMATIAGFPFDYSFPARAMANRYRHIGDAVPPVISYQIGAAVKWMLTGERPVLADMVLPNTTLRVDDIRSVARIAAE